MWVRLKFISLPDTVLFWIDLGVLVNPRIIKRNTQNAESHKVAEADMTQRTL